MIIKQFGRIIFLVLISLAFMACQSKLSSTQPQIGQEVKVKAGEKVVFEGGMTLQFNKVIGDSRCPREVQCFWAGNAEIVIHFNQQKQTLNTFLEPKQVVAGDYVIQLKALSPYPVRRQQIAPDEYVATFLVNREK